MSNNDALEQLAAIAGKSSVAAAFEAARHRVVNETVPGLDTRSIQRRASDLIGVILALSARTRRVVQPRVAIDLDVFTPRGRRAVALQFGRRSE